jgi:hypothetical protein
MHLLYSSSQSLPMRVQRWVTPFVQSPKQWRRKDLCLRGYMETAFDLYKPSNYPDTYRAPQSEVRISCNYGMPGPFNFFGPFCNGLRKH